MKKRKINKKNQPRRIDFSHVENKLERITGVEPALTAWEAVVLPMNYIRIVFCIIQRSFHFVKSEKRFLGRTNRLIKEW